MQLALVMETRNMAVSHAVSAQKREKTPRTAWDAVTPYKSGKTRDDWDLALGSRANGRCVCCACGDGLGSFGAFDKHQKINSKGNVVCLDPATIGMERNSGGWWVTPNPMYGEEQAS